MEPRGVLVVVRPYVCEKLTGAIDVQTYRIRELLDVGPRSSWGSTAQSTLQHAEDEPPQFLALSGGDGHHWLELQAEN
jgi:hypothetical protein